MLTDDVYKACAKGIDEIKKEFKKAKKSHDWTEAFSDEIFQTKYLSGYSDVRDFGVGMRDLAGRGSMDVINPFTKNIKDIYPDENDLYECMLDGLDTYKALVEFNSYPEGDKRKENMRTQMISGKRTIGGGKKK